MTIVVSSTIMYVMIKFINWAAEGGPSLYLKYVYRSTSQGSEGRPIKCQGWKAGRELE